MPLGPNIEELQQMCPQNKSERGVKAQYPYVSLVGALMYLANATRPNISYVVNTFPHLNLNFNVTSFTKRGATT